MRWRRPRRQAIAGAELHKLSDETARDPETGAVTSKQTAEVLLPPAELEVLWTPANLERLARTYWSTLRRFFLGLVYVVYSESERSVVLVSRRLPLLTFRTPEYEMDHRRGLVRWRIERGILVSKRGRDGSGYLQLAVERLGDAGEKAKLRVEVEVANYYPTLTGLSTRLYADTQSRIHVLVCSYFLRRLLRRDLDTSRIGRLAASR